MLPAPTVAGAEDQLISFRDRVLAVGMTQSGKSELLRYLFTQIQARRVLIDPKGEWRIDGVPAYVVAKPADVERIDWSAPSVHVQPRWVGYNKADREHLQPLYRAIAELHGDAVVWTDEAYGVSSSSWAPTGLLALQTAGARLGHGHWVATQRPRNIASELKTEADHLFLFPPVDVEDLKECRRGMAFLDQDRALTLMQQLPRHGYLWANRKTQQLSIGPPLPAELRAAGDVRRR